MENFWLYAVLTLVTVAFVNEWVQGFRNARRGGAVSTDDDDDDKFTVPLTNPATGLPMDDDGMFDSGGYSFGDGPPTHSDD